MIEFTLPEPTILLNAWQRLHWQARRRHTTELAKEVLAAIGHKPSVPIQRCRIEIERHSTRFPDWDGLYGGLKPLLDCLVVARQNNPHGLGIILDDNPEVIRELKAIPVKSTRKGAKTVVRIFEVK